jgi:branched-chain amino acid transport system permease protein
LIYGISKYYLAIFLPGFQLLVFAPIIILIIVMFPEGVVGMLKSRLKYTAVGKFII